MILRYEFLALYELWSLSSSHETLGESADDSNAFFFLHSQIEKISTKTTISRYVSPVLHMANICELHVELQAVRSLQVAKPGKQVLTPVYWMPNSAKSKYINILD